MQQKIINTQDLAFQLFELQEVEQALGYERYAEHSRDTLEALAELLGAVDTTVLSMKDSEF